MNDYRAYVECDYNSIYHHGVKGQKWGVRRYQNEDGSLTPLGKKRLGRLIDARNEYEAARQEHVKAANAEYKYMRSVGRGRGEDYKQDKQDLYIDDEKFRPIADRNIETGKRMDELGKKYTREFGRAANFNNGPIFVLGRDNVRQILEDYDRYNSGERKKLVNNKHESTNKEIATQRKNLQRKSQEAWNKIEEYRSKKGIVYGDDDLKLYNSDSKYKKIVDEAESIDKELREFNKKNRR